MSHLVVVARGTTFHGVGGMERHTEDLCAALVGLGHQVSVVTTESPKLPKSANGVVFFPVAGTRPNRYTGAWWRGLVPALTRLQETVGPIDGVVSQSTAAQSAVHWLVAKKMRLAYILHGSARDIMRENRGMPSTRALLRYILAAYYWRWNLKVLPEVPLLFAVGNDLAERLQRDFLAKGAAIRLRVLTNPVDTVSFCPGSKLEARRQLGLSHDQFLVGYSGRLTHAKGVDWIRRFAERQGSRLGLAAAIAGEGPLTATMKGQHLRYFGSLDKARLGQFYQALDVLLLPTRHREGVPLSVLEAMASGIPVVAFDSGGLREVMDIESGILVDPGDFEGFSRAVLRLQENEAERALMGRNARKRMLARPSWQEVAETVVKGLADQGSGSHRD